jgi:SRSO17 transposase
MRVEGQRWAIEDAFKTAKTELGLKHNETRSWHGWHRLVSLVMLAFAMMAVVRQRANALTSSKKVTKRGCSAGTLVCPGNPPRVVDGRIGGGSHHIAAPRRYLR